MTRPTLPTTRRGRAGAVAIAAIIAVSGGFAASNSLSDSGGNQAFINHGHGSCNAHPDRPACTTTAPAGTTTTTSPATTTSTTVPPGSTPRVGHPEDTGAQICGNSSQLNGPASFANIATVDPAAPQTVVKTYTGTLTNGSPTMTAVSPTPQSGGTTEFPRYYATGPAGFTTTYIASTTTNSITFNANYSGATGSKTVTVLSVVDVPPGDNLAAYGNSFNLKPSVTYFITAGTHHFGNTATGSHYFAKPGDVFIGQGDPDGAGPLTGGLLSGDGGDGGAAVQQFAIANAPRTAANVTIEYLEVANFNAPDDQGTINQDTNDGWKIRHDYLHNNHGGAMMGGNGESVTFNCLKNNGQYAFNFYQAPGSATPPTSLPPNPAGGSTILSATLDHNEIVGNNTELLDHPGHPGPGASGGGKFWNVQNATVTNNWVHDNHGTGLWADTDNNGFKVEGNYIADNEFEGFWYEISYNARLDHNLFLNNNWYKGPKEGAGFPDGAIYISESGGDSRVTNTFGYSKIEIDHNNFVDNWNGITIWANPDRYCPNGLPDTVYCTMVNVSGGAPATHSTCGTSYINTTPGIDDCRWKAQNSDVHDNSFSLTPANVTSTNPAFPGAACSFANGCGYNAIFSKFGSTSPYCNCGAFANANMIEDQMSCSGWLSGGSNCGPTPTNHFHANTYVGDWRFEIHEQGAVIHWSGTSGWTVQTNGPAGNGSNRHTANDDGSTCSSCS